MNISTHDKKILFVCFRRLLFLTLAFLLGSLAGKAELSLGIHPVSGPVLSTSENWGLSFPEEGTLPTANASIEELKQYDAYYAQDTDEKILYLTFDCGYENGFTPKILDVLKKEKVPAAFFVTKPFIREDPELVKRMKKEGHVVGNHTVHHKSMPTVSDRDNKQELIDCAEYCKKTTGYDIDMFMRPPMGEYSEHTLALTKKLGYKTIFWSMAYVDFNVNSQPGKDYVVQHFEENYHNGAIPLMHNVSQSNAEALETVIRNMKAKGFESRSLKKLPDY